MNQCSCLSWREGGAMRVWSFVPLISSAAKALKHPMFFPDLIQEPEEVCRKLYFV